MCTNNEFKQRDDDAAFDRECKHSAIFWEMWSKYNSTLAARMQQAEEAALQALEDKFNGRNSER